MPITRVKIYYAIDGVHIFSEFEKSKKECTGCYYFNKKQCPRHTYHADGRFVAPGVYVRKNTGW